VAGYDLCKLHVGALGTLGIITQVTLKVRPRPEARALVMLGSDGPGLGPLLDQLHQSCTRPGVLDVVNAAAARAVTTAARVALPDAPWVVVVGFEDSDDAISWQVRQLITEVSPAGVCGLEARAGAASDAVWDALVELPAQPSARLAFKANLLPAAVADFCLHAAGLHAGAMVHAHAGSGIVRGHFAGDLTLVQVQEMLKGMHERLRKAQGNVVLTQCPAEWKRTLPVWGLPRDDAWLMRRVKEALDPRRLFNPGRFVDGI
jgi:glycolate oxidase FAD binding subunit